MLSNVLKALNRRVRQANDLFRCQNTIQYIEQLAHFCMPTEAVYDATAEVEYRAKSPNESQLATRGAQKAIWGL